MDLILLAAIEWHHGEYETMDFRIVQASPLEEAVEKVMKHLGESGRGQRYLLPVLGLTQL